MKISINDNFWNKRLSIIQETMLPFQWKILNDSEENAPKSGVIKNFKIAAHESTGEFYGMVFQDTDLYKWIEAVAYSLKIKPNKQLQEWADEAIRLISESQMDDGYINTYFQIFKPDLKWTSLTDNHELYTFGHLIEAGVAYYKVTGNKIIYNVIIKVANLLVKRFGQSKPTTGLPGHPEIELALLRLYDLTKDKNYLELASYFVLERGKDPNFFIEEPTKRREKGIPNWLEVSWNDGFVSPKHETDEDVSYYVASKQLINQFVAEGHAVRACYLYCALADLARETNNEILKNTAERLFENVTTKQMYVTGGIGQTNQNEGFTFDFDLPNETNYCETCAGISLIFWAKRMMTLSTDSKYANIIERTLYNNTLGSMSLDGTSFYYRNELERWGKNIVKAGRPTWHSCACCPPNLARLLLSLDDYICHQDMENNTLFINQFIGSKIECHLANLSIKSNLPWDNKIKIHFEKVSDKLNFGVRLPEWSLTYTLSINGANMYEGIDYTVSKGYIIIKRKIYSGDSLEYTLELSPKAIYANANVKHNAGKFAISRGPLIYCIEEEENGANLWQLEIETDKFDEYLSDDLEGIVKLSTNATRNINHSHSLYSYQKYLLKNQKVTAIPFYTRYNRSIGEMQVWHRYAKNS